MSRAAKMRALVTHGAVQGRDIHVLSQIDQVGFPIEEGGQDAAGKIAFSTANWDRYNLNPRWRDQLPAALRDGEPEKMALRPIDQATLAAFARRLVAATARALESGRP